MGVPLDPGTGRASQAARGQAGLPVYGDADNRRVPGLRREEVALLAGVSVDYYTRLERGNAAGVSDSVLEALALDPRSTEFYVDWDDVANQVVSMLRSEAGRDPYDRALSDLVGELSTRSENFRIRWAAHDVRFHDTGVKKFNHPVVGELTLSYESMELAADPGLTLFAYTVDPGSKSEQALNLLASWAATADDGAATRVSEDA